MKFNKKEKEEDSTDSSKEKEHRPKNVRLMDSPKGQSAGSRRSNVVSRGPQNTDTPQKNTIHASELASVSGLSTISNKR